MRYKIPAILLRHFEGEALKSKHNGQNVATLALGIGKVENDCCLVEELVFPNQKTSTDHAEDIGKSKQMYSILT